MIQRHHKNDSDLMSKFDTSCLSDFIKQKQQQSNSRTCSDFDLHNLSYTISPSVDYHSLNSYYSPKNFNTPTAYSYVSEDYLHSLNPVNNSGVAVHQPKQSHNLLTYSPSIDANYHQFRSTNYLGKLTKRKQLFVNSKSEMQCNLSPLKMSPSSITKQLSTSTYFDPESLVSYTLQSNVNKKCNSKSTPCLTAQTFQTSPMADQVDSMVKASKSKRKSAINWPFKLNNSSSTLKRQSTGSTSTPSFSIQQHTSKTVSMLHRKLLSKSQSNLKTDSKSAKSSPLSIMSNVTTKKSSNKKQTIKLFGQSIGKLCLGDRHLIAPVKNMLIELMQRAPQTVGIFRKSANARVCRELKAELEQNPDCDLREYPIIVIASVFKELLRSLPDCLLVGKMYPKWLEAAKIIDNQTNSASEYIAFIRPLIKSLPKANSLLLQHFLCILHYITLQSNENKMSAENLAVCIGPSLLNHHDVAPMNCELSKQVPKLISFLIKNCAELFGASTLNLFETYQNMVNENKENEMNENKENELKEKAKDSGAEESDSLNSLQELNNNISDHKVSTNLNYRSPVSYPLSSTYSSVTYSSSTNCTPKTTTIARSNDASQQHASLSSSIASDNKVPSSENHHFNTTAHQSFYISMLGQQTPYAVNKVSLSNLSRDSGLTLSDTQLELYSPEEDDDDDYQVIINQHLNLDKKLNNIASGKCVSSSPFSSHKNQFKVNSNNTKISKNNSTSLKKKCNNKVNAISATTSSEEDELHYELEDVDIDELSEKSLSSDHCTPLYSRVYNKRVNVSNEHPLTKSAPQLATIETIGQSQKTLRNDANQIVHSNNEISRKTMFFDSIKNNSLSTDSATNSSCNSPSSASNVSSTSLNLSSSNEYSTSDLPRNYFSSLVSEPHLASTPITSADAIITNKTTVHHSDLHKTQQVVNAVSAKSNSPQVPSIVCDAALNKQDNSNNNQKPIISSSNAKVNKSTISIAVPPSYQETMNRKEINARMANLIQANTSRKISNCEFDNLISKKIYEQSMRVFNADTNKDLTLRAVPVHVQNLSSSDSELSADESKHHPKRKINNNTKSINKSTNVDQIDGIVKVDLNYATQVRCKPIVQQRCAKDEYWKKDVNWSVATLRNKFTELCKQNDYSTLNRERLTKRSNDKTKFNTCKSVSSIYDLCKKSEPLTVCKPPINKLRSNYSSQSSQILENANNGNKNCVTIIQITHGSDKYAQSRSTDCSSGEESYV